MIVTHSLKEFTIVAMGSTKIQLPVGTYPMASNVSTLHCSLAMSLKKMLGATGVRLMLVLEIVPFISDRVVSSAYMRRVPTETGKTVPFYQ